MYKVRDEVKQRIMTQYVESSYEHDVESLILGRRGWKRMGQAFETMSKVFLALGGILSFSSGYYHIGSLSFLSGSVSVISLAFLQFSSFCYLENKKQSNELNIILRKLGLETVPELSRESENVILQRTPQDIVNMRKATTNNDIELYLAAPNEKFADRYGSARLRHDDNTKAKDNQEASEELNSLKDGTHGQTADTLTNLMQVTAAERIDIEK